MPDVLVSAFGAGLDISPVDVALRLLVALLFGGAVAWIYRRGRGAAAANSSFPGTLVLLAVLIAMVTQVIGDNVARAFSLVGALSIVRFRTVVRDTQDTAYVIFAVVVGMAVGAHNLWVAAFGLVVISLAAWLLRRLPGRDSELTPAWSLALRVGLGHDPKTVLRAAFTAHLQKHDLVSVETARQGVALDLVYEAQFKTGASADAFVKDLNRVEGVQDVSVKRRNFDPST